jgi:hypothetical protein
MAVGGAIADPAAADPRVSDDDVFVDLVRLELDRLGCDIARIDVREAVVSGRMRGVVGLRNIQQSCAPLPRGEWRLVIAEHLTGLAKAHDRHLDLRDLTSVRASLRTRLYDESSTERSMLAGKLLAPGLFEALVVDQAETVHGVPTGVADKWHEDLDELMTLARGQVLDDGLLQRQHLDLGATTATLLEDASPYTTAHLHWLASYVDVPVAGALVVAPTRSCLVVHPMVEREPTLAAAQALLVNAARLYDAGPGAVSPHLYWWRAGDDLVLLPGSADGEKVELRPPTEFVNVLENLP